MKKLLIIAVLVLLVAVFPESGSRGETSGHAAFTRKEVMVPMRDGVHLQTVIFTPQNATGPLPILFTRTPYGIPSDDKELTARGGVFEELVADGYIFVWQNLRGRFKSEGEFVMNRAPRNRKNTRGIDETTDAWDSVDWLVKNVPNNNGRAGIWGISYSGWTTAMALIEPHPALKAASEQASPADMFLGDDFHHNGAFRLSYGFEYAALLESSKEQNTHFQFDKYDTYEWYLSLGALANVNSRFFHGKLPTWNDFVDHPDYDNYWKSRAFEPYLHHTSVPNLNVAGWYDQEDFYGPMKIYDQLEKTDREHRNYVVVGPWNHGGWMSARGRQLGQIDFASDTAKWFRAKVQAPWFAYWLHGKGQLQQPEALAFQTGSNDWKSYSAWPPAEGITTRKLYFREGNRLSFDPPDTSGVAADTYISDPADPVPYRPRPITPTYPGPEWPVWLLQDQRFVDHRPDVLGWQTEPLTQSISVAGDIVADLFASTSGSDCDWIVKLIDVYPEDYIQPESHAHLGGYELIISDEVFRGRFHKSFEHPEPLVSNQPTHFRIDLHTRDHAFLKGHKIMVQIQSTWFPLIDRNPQKFVPNIFEASDSDYVRATQRIFRSRELPSAIVLPVDVRR
ncbi:MAG: CocE/NonD family hydrolase [Bryobacteraceae bacterium]